MKRRREGKTDYKARVGLLMGEKGRVVFRKTNRYITGQYIESKEARDKIIVGVNSKELLNYDWPKSNMGSLKSIPACYFTGFLLGKKMLDKEIKNGIFDIGLNRNVKKSKIYGFLKGVVDSGIKINCKEEVFPEEKRLRGGNSKAKLNFEEIKKNIEKKFV